MLEDAGFTVLQAETAENAQRMARERPISVALLDVQLPGRSGYELCRSLRETFGYEIGIIFLSGSRTELLDRAAGLALGGDDYLVKPVEVEELVARVRALARRVQASRAQTATAFALTVRELEVLKLLAQGLEQDEIAEQLVIAPKTVATHIERILGKLGVHSRAQAVAVAYREELVRTE